jgi:hypothetical protein
MPRRNDGGGLLTQPQSLDRRFERSIAIMVSWQTHLSIFSKDSQFFFLAQHLLPPIAHTQHCLPP